MTRFPANVTASEKTPPFRAAVERSEDLSFANPTASSPRGSLNGGFGSRETWKYTTSESFFGSLSVVITGRTSRSCLDARQPSEYAGWGARTWRFSLMALVRKVPGSMIVIYSED